MSSPGAALGAGRADGAVKRGDRSIARKHAAELVEGVRPVKARVDDFRDGFHPCFA